MANKQITTSEVKARLSLLGACSYNNDVWSIVSKVNQKSLSRPHTVPTIITFIQNKIQFANTVYTLKQTDKLFKHILETISKSNE